MRLSALAAHLKAELVPGAGQTRAVAEALDLTALAPIAHAGAGSVTFLTNEEYASYLPTCRASAVIVKASRDSLHIAQLVHPNPYWAFAVTAQIFFPPKKETPGVSAAAFVESTAVVAESATIYPGAYVGSGARIGARAVLYPGVFVGDGAVVGDGTVLRANVVIEHGVVLGSRVLVHAGSVLGADGFGFAPGADHIAKIPQVGKVVVGDDVEIGGLCTVDRGALEDTRIAQDAKLDSHVHIGHGAVLGEHSMMCAFSGLAGSARVGNWVMLGGHSAVDNRVEIADRVRLGAMSAMTKDATEPGETYVGFPAIPAREWRRQVARVRRLEGLEQRVAQLEARLAEAAGLGG